MFWRNKQKPLVLTGTTCRKIERLRLAVEVLTGRRVRLGCLDFGTCKGELIVGEEAASVLFPDGLVQDSYFRIELSSDSMGGDFVVRFDRVDVEEARVIASDMQKSLRRAGHSMWLVGRSFSERWEIPLYPDEVEYCAKAKGVTVEDYLKG